MAKRYRYAFTKKKEASKGKLSIGLAVMSLFLLGTALGVSIYLDGQLGFIVGGISLFAMLISIYGFLMGLSSFSEENRMHRTSIVGSISNGIIVVVWLAFYLVGIQ